MQHIYSLVDHFMASYTGRIVLEALDLLGQLWPYLLGGILLSTAVRFRISRDWLTGFFSGRRSPAAILVAALVGVVSPLGSYVVIPLSAALLGAGLPLSVPMALLVSGPLMNPNLFVLTAGAMGLEMALMRTFSALLLGILAGYAALWLQGRGKLIPGELLRQDADSGAAPGRGGPIERNLQAFMRELWKMTRYISRYFFLALLLAAALKIMVNPRWIVRLFDGDSLLPVVLSTAAGIPFYVCGGAAIPVVQTLADLGMSQGAALAYFISGPATKISNLVILHAAFRRKVMWLYLFTVLTGAIVLGLLYNLK